MKNDYVPLKHVHYQMNPCFLGVSNYDLCICYSYVDNTSSRSWKETLIFFIFFCHQPGFPSSKNNGWTQFLMLGMEEEKSISCTGAFERILTMYQLDLGVKIEEFILLSSGQCERPQSLVERVLLEWHITTLLSPHTPIQFSQGWFTRMVLPR